MEQEPVISVIMPAYQSASTIARALDSVINQDIQLPYEIIISLDQGNDATANIVSFYAKEHKNIKVFSPRERMGQGISRLRGIEISRGEYLYFMDADDRLSPSCLSTLYQVMIREKADCVNCSFYTVSGKAKEKIRPFPFAKAAVLNRKETFEAFFADIWFRGYLWTKMFRKSAIKKGPFLVLADKKDMFEDVALVCSFLMNCQKTISIKNRLYYYYQNVATSAMTVRRSDRALRHLDVFALERDFIEKSADKTLRLAFKKSLFRSWLSLLFDLSLDKKNGADRTYRSLVYSEWKYVKDFTKPLVKKNRTYEPLLIRAYQYDDNPLKDPDTPFSIPNRH